MYYFFTLLSLVSENNGDYNDIRQALVRVAQILSKHSIDVPDKFDVIKAVTENILNILVDSPRNQLFEEPVF